MSMSCSITASPMGSTLFLADWLFRSAAVKHMPWNLMGLGPEVVQDISILAHWVEIFVMSWQCLSRVIAGWHRRHPPPVPR